MVPHDPTAHANGLLSLFLELRPALTRFLAARGAQPAECEDLLQDLYVKLAGGATGPVAEPRAYLYRMTNNLLIDQRRSAQRRSGREEAWSGTAPGEQREIDPQPSAEDALLARERLQVVSDALAALPERTRDVFRRYRLDGQPQKVIAAELAISVSAIEKHLQRAYRAIVDSRADFDADIARPHRLSGERGKHGA